MNVTVVRPINNADTTYFHVHAAGCRDLKSRKYPTQETTAMPVQAVRIANTTTPAKPVSGWAKPVGTDTVTADPKFARLLDELDADVIDGIIVFTDDEGRDLEIAPINTGWFIRNEAGEALTPILTKWECAFLLRDWDGEAPTAEPTNERKVHA